MTEPRKPQDGEAHAPATSSHAAPRVSRARRGAFLAPVWLFAGLGLVALAALLLVVVRGLESSTVILVRHAEKDASSAEDPPLSAEGQRRAERLAYVLGDPGAPGRPVAILASDTRRAQQTALPLARALAIPIETIPRGDPAATIDAIGSRHRGQAVLVVGHSNTLPEIVARLSRGQISIAIGDGEYQRLWILNRPGFGPARLQTLRY